MARISVALMSVALAGCLRSTGGKVGATFVGVGAPSGILYGIVCGDYGSSEHTCESTSAVVMGGAILIALAGGAALAIISEATYDAPAPEEPAPIAASNVAADPELAPGGTAALYEPIEPRDPLAHRLTLQAHNAAAHGQCAGIPPLAKRVRALDAEYYARVFAADPPIARCSTGDRP